MTAKRPGYTKLAAKCFPAIPEPLDNSRIGWQGYTSAEFYSMDSGMSPVRASPPQLTADCKTGIPDNTMAVNDLECTHIGFANRAPTLHSGDYQPWRPGLHAHGPRFTHGSIHFIMRITTLHDALVHELQDLYSAELQLATALPNMAKASAHEELTQAFEEHLEQTKDHAKRLEKALRQLDAPALGENCQAMEGLIEESESTLDLNTSDEVRDALIISIAQKVEHYEIAGYGTARTFAKLLGEDRVLSLLSDTLEEEAKADQNLTRIAETVVNRDAELGGVEENT
jgi:ferritin-like metal-binding protein YciE